MTKTTIKQVVCVFFLVLSGISAQAQLVTSNADDGSPGTLRNQIASASSGDVITFFPGVSNIILTSGQITIDKSLAITGLSTVTINGNASGRIFDITSGIVLLNNLTLTNGLADNGGAVRISDADVVLNNVTVSNSVANGASGSGGGILVSTDASLAANNSVFSGNTANRAGGGIECVAGTTLNLNGVTLSGNNAGIAPAIAAPGNGGGIHVTGTAQVTIVGGTVVGNMAASEGGGLWNGSGTMSISGTIITANTASGIAADNGGGGIYNLNAGTLQIEDATISNNNANGTSGSGGGILNDLGGIVTIESSTITGNTSNRAGGGIENNAGQVTLVNVNLNGNTTFTAPGNGGGLHVTGAGTTMINGGTVNGNSAGAEGGGLWNGTGTMSVDGTTIDGNTASGAGSDQGGGGIYNLNGGTLTIANATISHNMANGTLGSGGGILNDVGSQLSITDTEISENTAIRAGGGIEDNSGSSTILLTNVDLLMNTVTGPPGNGGGLHITGGGNATIIGGTVSGNMAFAEGGGLWNGTGLMTITGTAITGNMASGAAADQGGGGIYNFNGGSIVISNADISDNIANGTLGSGGGILNDVGAQLTISDSMITGNSAVRAGGGIEDNSGTSILTLTNVNIENNVVTGPPGNGGGLHITGGGSINIVGGTVNGNMAALEGGGLWNGSGTMNVSGTEISGNVASGSAADDGGGGIFNNGGTLNITGAMIANNLATGTSGSGGGLFTLAGAVTILDSSFDSNSANRAGGAIEAVNGTLTINGGSLINNDVDGTASGTPNPGNGGALHVTAVTNTTLSGTIVSGNEARREGGGLWNQTGSVMTLTNTTVDSNAAHGPDAVHGGGGIFNNGGSLVVNNSTVSNNLCDGASANGGGIHIKAGDAIVFLSTISGNASMATGGGIYNNAVLNVNASTIANNDATASGGGIANNSATTPSLKNTIVASNNSATGADLSSISGVFVSNGYNLIGADDANVFAPATGDIEGQDPLLGALADNGGSTFTHLLQVGSPAYNMGDPSDMFADQIGMAVFGGIRDIGALEAQSQLGVEESISVNTRSRIYPNPSVNGQFSIQTGTAIGASASGSIVEVGSGKVVKTFSADGSVNVIDVSGFASGVYIIKLASERNVESHRLIIGR